MSIKLYPLQFKENLIEKVWGGDALGRLLGKNVSSGQKIGESWEVSDYGDKSSVVSVGDLAGLTLRDLLKNQPQQIVGSKLSKKYPDKFPLLIKFLDAEDNLSIQVHPDDKQVKELGVNDSGKTECWYVLHAEPGAKIIKGVKENITKQEFRKSIEDNAIVSKLDMFDVSTGDFLFLPAGTIHAICEGVIIAEIQQTSDVTFRLYDYNRMGLDGAPRELHIEESIAVANLKKIPDRFEVPLEIDCDGAKRLRLNKCDYFLVDKLEIESEVLLKTNDSLQIIMVVDGSGFLKHLDGDDIEIKKGMTLLVPACLNKYRLSGNVQVLLIEPL